MLKNIFNIPAQQQQKIAEIVSINKEESIIGWQARTKRKRVYGNQGEAAPNVHGRGHRNWMHERRWGFGMMGWRRWSFEWRARWAAVWPTQGLGWTRWGMQGLGRHQLRRILLNSLKRTLLCYNRESAILTHWSKFCNQSKKVMLNDGKVHS